MSAQVRVRVGGARPRRELPPHAGLVSQRRARSSGTLTSVYRAREADIATDEQAPWASVCEEHGSIVTSATRRLAEQAASHPEDWCGECQPAAG